ncbi:MAG: NADH-quinone oxidoreductase subunit C [Candidatus Altiarchaeota archaeon]|nr:NADH-quinone oxidoreductase subunit C [Candidatus Altiarchaeota archaeon]
MTSKKQNIIDIKVEELLDKAGEMQKQGYRLVQMHGTRLEEGFEINYSFDKDYNFVNYRIRVKEGDEVPSITGSYWGAFLYENEIHEFFGVQITGINVDFKGHLYKKKTEYPFAVKTGGGKK